MIESDNRSIRPLNTPLDLDEIQELLEARVAIEVLEERLELGCWAHCDACILKCTGVT